MTTNKTNLNTNWNFNIYVQNDEVVYGIQIGNLNYRITKHPYQPGWTVDVLPPLTPWEEFVDGPFTTLEDAARALIEKLAK